MCGGKRVCWQVLKPYIDNTTAFKRTPSLSVPYQRSTSVPLRLQISPHKSDASARRLAVSTRGVSSCLCPSPSCFPSSGNVMCFPGNCPRNLLKKWDVKRLGFRLPLARRPQSNYCCVTPRSQRAQGHESSLFGTRLFNR